MLANEGRRAPFNLGYDVAADSLLFLSALCYIFTTCRTHQNYHQVPMNTVRFSSNTRSAESTVVSHLDSLGDQRMVHEDDPIVLQERAGCEEMTTSENRGPQKCANRCDEVVCPLFSETSPTSLKFSLSQLWSRQRLFQTPSSSLGPMSRPVSAPPQTVVPDVLSRRSSAATLLPPMSSVESSRRSSLGQQRATSFVTATTASTSAPASSSSVSSCTLPHTPEEVTFSDHAEYTMLVSTTSSRLQDALTEVQKRIIEGREQLDHYNSMIQRHECQRAEAWESRAALQHKRDNLAQEIEDLEGKLKYNDSLTPAAAVGLNRPSIKRQNSLFTNTAGFLWSMSPPKGSLETESGWEPVLEACCLSTHSSTPHMAAIGESNLASATSMTNNASLSPTSAAPASPLSSRSAAPAQPITLLRELQTDMDQIQQRLSIMTSQIKHLQRTFVAPIEKCLAEDRDIWARLSTAD
ncbi:unnamed protein product [Mortierella alpina]